MRAFRIALQFLTRLPVSAPADCTAHDQGRSVLYYPLVGLVIGTLLALLGYALAQSEALVRAALLLVAWVLITGGLHLDGLADSADAWLGGHGNRERTLEIMKDPRSGPAAVMLVTLVLIVKFAALSALAGPAAWPLLLLAPLLGRAAIVGLFLTTPYVRENGLGSKQAHYLPRGGGILILILSAGAVLLVGRWRGVLLLGIATGGVCLLRRMMLTRIGGTTGDTLGAACEIIEALVLVTWVLAGD